MKHLRRISHVFTPLKMYETSAYFTVMVVFDNPIIWGYVQHNVIWLLSMISCNHFLWHSYVTWDSLNYIRRLFENCVDLYYIV